MSKNDLTHPKNIAVIVFLILLGVVSEYIPSHVKTGENFIGLIAGGAVVFGSFYCCHPYVGVLALLVVFYIVTTSSDEDASKTAIPAEPESSESYGNMDTVEHTPHVPHVEHHDDETHEHIPGSGHDTFTLEEEIISKMVPVTPNSVSSGNSDYLEASPVLDTSIGASEL